MTVAMKVNISPSLPFPSFPSPFLFLPFPPLTPVSEMHFFRRFPWNADVIVLAKIHRFLI